MFGNRIAMIAAAFLAATSTFATQKKPVALKGLDPVQLVAGKEVKGLASLAAEQGRFRYLFTNPEDEKAFKADPSAYAVQNAGKCVMMPDMDGDPNLYVVYKGKIYLTGSDSCYSAVKASPASYIDAQTEPATKTVVILLFSPVEIIDYSGPWEVFGGAGYKVVTVAASKDPIRTVYGETVIPDYTFADCPKPDILLLPGGGVPTLDRSTPTMQWIAKTVAEAPHTLSVCNGAFWLARDGLLDGLSATTTAGNLDRLATQFPKINVVRDQRVVDNGKIVTSGGLSAGIDGALHMVEKMDGADTAKSIAIGIEYNWGANDHYAPGNFANKYLRRAGNVQLPTDVKAEEQASLGDENHWQERWTLTAQTSTSADILASIEKTLAAAKWQKVSSDATTAIWSFKGDDGSTWHATYTITPDPAVKGKFAGSSELAKVA